MEFSSAGILFQDIHKGQFLSGFNPKLQSWSGLGGKRIGNETAWETAIREVVEELYGIHLPSASLNTLHESIHPMEYFQNGDYICFVLPIEYVFKLGKLLSLIEYKSPFYPEGYPTTIDDLIEKRTLEGINHVEITELMLLKPNFHGPIDFYFLSDIKHITRNQEH